MSEQKPTLKVAGLYTNPNPDGEVPEGSLLRAVDTVCVRPGLLGPIRGQASPQVDQSVLTGRVLSMGPDGLGGVLMHAVGGGIARYSSALAISSAGSASAASGANRLRFCQAEGGVFFPTDSSLSVFDTASLAVRKVGLGVPCDTSGALVGGLTAATGGLQPGYEVAYRFLYVRTLSDGRKVRSAPSGRLVVRNPTFKARAQRVANVGTVDVGTATLPFTPSVGDTVEVTEADGVTKNVRTVTAATASTVSFADAGADFAYGLYDRTLSLRTRPVDISIPAGDQSGYYGSSPLGVELYRSANSPILAGSSPSDEMRLVYALTPTTSQWNLGHTIRDIVPDSLRGEALYTNATQDGILGANEPPPYVTDLAYWRDTLFGCDVRPQQRLTLRLLATGGTAGVRAGTTLSFDNATTYTGHATLETGNNFRVYTTGDVAYDLEMTARSIARKLASNMSVRAQYISGENDPPGILLVESRRGVAFQAATNERSEAWLPDLVQNLIFVSSSGPRVPGRVAWSKPNAPEAWPATNYLDVGDPQRATLRLIALKDSLLVLKEDGFFRIFGDAYGGFDWEAVDTNVSLVAPETAVRLDNECWCLTTQGVVAASDSSVRVMSFPVENLLFTDKWTDATVRSNAFGVAYETERTYLLWAPGLGLGGAQALTFNTANETWMQRSDVVQAGFVHPATNRLLLAPTSEVNRFTIERKALTTDDFIRDILSWSAATFDGDIVTFVVGAPVRLLDFGDRISVDESEDLIVLQRLSDTTYRVANPYAVQTTLAPADTMLRYAIRMDLTWNPDALGNRSLDKQFAEAQFHLLVDSSAPARLSLSDGRRLPIEGYVPYAQTLISPDNAGRNLLRAWLPRASQRGASVTLRLELSPMQEPVLLCGLGVRFNTTGLRAGR